MISQRSACVASREQAVIDAIRYPNRVPMDETLECLESGLDLDRLRELVANIPSPVFRRRLGYLLERTGLEVWFETPGTGSYLSLDPRGPRKGSHDQRWRIIDNLEVG